MDGTTVEWDESAGRERSIGHIPAVWIILLASAIGLPGEWIQPAACVVLEGSIRNGSTGSAGRAERVVLSLLEESALELASTQETEGTFRLELAGELAAGTYLLQAFYRGISYNELVDLESGESFPKVVLTVYDITDDPEVLRVTIPHVVVRRISANRLHIDKTIQVRNESDPPRTYVTDKGSVRIDLAEDFISLHTLSFVSGSLPIRITPIETEEPNVVGVDHPVRPGESRIHISGTVDYENESYRFTETVRYRTDVVGFFLVPGDFEVSTEGVEDLGFREEVRAQVLRAIDPPLGSRLAVSLSGGSVMPFPEEEPSSAESDVRVLLVPNPTHRYGPWVMATLAAVLFSGAYFLVRSRGAGKRDLILKKSIYLNEIVDLEDALVAGEISDEEFERSALRARRKLRSVIREIEESGRA